MLKIQANVGPGVIGLGEIFTSWLSTKESYQHIGQC